MRYLTLLLLLAQTIYASETWRCTEEGTTREGNVFVGCGMGTHYNEDRARELAFENAISEFQTLCKIDSYCKRRKVSVEPGRTTCDSFRKGTLDLYKCYRLIRFSIH